MDHFTRAMQKAIQESVETGVVIDHKEYRVHTGRLPQGTGTWKFASTNIQRKPGATFIVEGTYEEATVKAKEWARENGLAKIYLHEND